MLLQFRPGLAALAVFVISLIVYLITMDPGLGYIDSGELATVCARLGIAHPTGYPLFTLLGWLFLLLPIPVSDILQLNIMAALFTAGAAGAVVLLVQEISDNWWSAKRVVTQDPKTKKKVETVIEPTRANYGALTGLVAGLIAAFNLTWWQQATSLEVYSLHILLITLSLYFFLRMLRKEDGDRAKDGLLFAVTLGLAFTNHLTSILLAPAMLYAFFARYGIRKDVFKRIGKLAIPFAAMLLIYLYLPLRASSDPILNWGDPSSWGQFWKHVTGGQYKIWMFTGQSAAANWSMFWSGLVDQFSLPVVILSVLGIPALIARGSKHRVNVLVFFLLLLFGCLLYAINYDINDIQSYFLLSYLTITVVAALGVELIVRQFVKANAMKPIAIMAIGLIAVGVEAATNYEQTDESGNYLVEDYTKNMLTNLPPNAIVFSTLWDFWVSGALYYQLVEGLRPDVVMIDKHLLRDRPWYFAHLRQRAPQVMKNVELEANEFLSHLVKFDRGEPFNEQAIGPAYQRLTTALVEKNSDRPIFMTAEMAEERDELFAPGVPLGPGGVAFAMGNTAPVMTLPKLTHRTRDHNKRGYYHDNARRLQAMPLALTASKLRTDGNIELARQYLELALSLKPAQQTSYDHLPIKEQDFANTTDAFFQQLEQMRAQLDTATR
jgi:hypothetical protein